MKKLIAWALLASATSLLAGCATSGGSPCDGWRPIRPAAADVATMSGDTVAQMLQHNKHGVEICGWRP